MEESRVFFEKNIQKTHYHLCICIYRAKLITQHVKGLIFVQPTGVGQFIRYILLNNSLRRFSA